MPNRRLSALLVTFSDLPICYLRNTALILSYSINVKGSVEISPCSDCALKVILLCHFQLRSEPRTPKMDSHGSSSSGPSADTRLESLEASLGRLRARLDNQDKLLQDSNKAGEQSWDLLNKDLRKLREDHSASAENLEDFKEETRTSFKDVANAQGDFGK